MTVFVALTVAAVAGMLSRPAQAETDGMPPAIDPSGPSIGQAPEPIVVVAQAPERQPRSTGPIELNENAPDRHVVVKGDTLWDISGKFLKSPWLWPQVWDLNREQIRNPHLIYPGNVVYLDRSGASPRLRLGRSVGDGSDGTGGANGERLADGQRRLEPLVRAQTLDKDAIPTISTAAIEAFINRPLIVDEKGLSTSPRIIATQEGRVYLGRGDRAYVRGIKDDTINEWHVYRPAKPLLDPDTRKPLAFEALYLGSAHLIRKGDPATVSISGTAEEIGEGDRLVPAEPARTMSFAPRAPEQDVIGKIISVYRGVTQVGRNNVVALNVGKKNGLDVGHVMTIQSTGRITKDRETNELVKLPNEPIGQLMVFRTFDTVSYALVLDAQQSISVGDTVLNP